MWKATILGAAALCWLAIATPSFADVPATLQLKSGERISGDLVDYGGVGFTIKVNGQQRQIPSSDVAVVEFSGQAQPNADVQQKLAAGHQVVVLKSGQEVEGSLYDMSGTQPLNIVMSTGAGQQTISSNDIAQIFMANPTATSQTAAVGTAGSQPAAPVPAGAIAVPANQQWTPTNLTVKKGENVYWQVTGQIQLSTNPNDQAIPAGALDHRTASGAPIPTALAGALIAKVGPNGQPFPIGGDARTTMPADGQLYLGINDDYVGDNTGQFVVQARIAK